MTLDAAHLALLAYLIALIDYLRRDSKGEA